MITGTGIDIVSINRIRKSIDEYGDKFIRKILSGDEISLIPAARRDEYIAGRFAAKEALVKASGLSFSFSEVSIINDDKGKPYLKRVPEHLNNKKIHISISHDTDYAAASAIIEE